MTEVCVTSYHYDKQTLHTETKTRTVSAATLNENHWCIPKQRMKTDLKKWQDSSKTSITSQEWLPTVKSRQQMTSILMLLWEPSKPRLLKKAKKLICRKKQNYHLFQ